MAEVMILCGKVAAGKTTFAKKVVKEQNAVLLSIDDLVIRLRDHCEGPKRLQKMESDIRAYFCALIQQLTAKDITCVVDHGHWTKASRMQLISFCREHGIPFRIILLECHREVRLRRLYRRNEQLMKTNTKGYVIDEEQLDRFDRWFEDPDEEERPFVYVIRNEEE